MEVLNTERKGYLRQQARGFIAEAELGELLSEIGERRGRLASELREAEAAMNARRSSSYSPVHVEWY